MRKLQNVCNWQNDKTEGDKIISIIKFLPVKYFFHFTLKGLSKTLMQMDLKFCLSVTNFSLETLFISQLGCGKNHNTNQKKRIAKK